MWRGGFITGCTTVSYTSINTFRTASYVWGALRRFFPEDVVASVRGLSLTKDERGAVFDVEDGFLPAFEKYIQEHGEGRPFAICTELPELKERELWGLAIASHVGSPREASAAAGTDRRDGAAEDSAATTEDIGREDADLERRADAVTAEVAEATDASAATTIRSFIVLRISVCLRS